MALNRILWGVFSVQWGGENSLQEKTPNGVGLEQRKPVSPRQCVSNYGSRTTRWLERAFWGIAHFRKRCFCVTSSSALTLLSVPCSLPASASGMRKRKTMRWWGEGREFALPSEAIEMAGRKSGKKRIGDLQWLGIQESCGKPGFSSWPAGRNITRKICGGEVNMVDCFRNRDNSPHWGPEGIWIWKERGIGCVWSFAL